MSEICGHVGGDSSGAVATVCQKPKGHAGKHGGMGCEWTDGGTPGRKFGDKGQRFEIHIYPKFWAGPGDTTFGWHSTLEGATKMADSFVLYPEAIESWVLDRYDRWIRVYETRKPMR